MNGTRSRGGHPMACRCEEVCRAADRDYAARRRRLEAYGQWQPFTDAETVRAHLRVLAAAGVSRQQAAALAGIPSSVMAYLVRGRPDMGYGPARRVRTETAQRLLAVKPVPANRAAGIVVSAAGTRRRLQALTTLGWSASRLAGHLGMMAPHLVKVIAGHHEVTAGTARKVAALYGRLWDQPPPETTKGERISASKARAHAARNDWPPPLAWDDDEIDDPAATPHPWKRGKLRDCAETAEDAAELLARGYTRNQVGERLGVKRTTLDHALNRAAASRQDGRAA